MEFKQIKLLYRHVISDTAVQEWEQLIWQVTYNEFLLRSQAYNTEHKFLLFSEMVAANGKANALHYKIGIQATPFINKLNNVIPHFIGTLHEPIRFEMAEVKLIESAINDISKHVIAITFTTPTFILAQIFGDIILCTEMETPSNPNASDPVHFMVKLKEGIGMDIIG